MHKLPFDEAELNSFFSRTFEEDVLYPHEMRLSDAELGYLTAQYSHIQFIPLSPQDAAGKTWFELRPKGAAI